MVVGIALAVSTPFILSAQKSVLNIQQTSTSVSIQKSLDRLDEAVSTVSVAGEPSRRTFRMELPDRVVAARIIQDRAVVYTLRRGSGKSNYSRVFDTNISAPGGLPDGSGSSKVSVVAWNGQVNISVVN